MVTHGNQDTRPRRSPQGSEGPTPEPNKINSSTPYDFSGKNLTPYGGLLPVITMLEKLGFQTLVEHDPKLSEAQPFLCNFSDG